MVSKERETSNAMYMLEKQRQTDLAVIANPNFNLPGSEATMLKIANALNEYLQAYNMRVEAETAEKTAQCQTPTAKPE